jgi:hypothetical protein
MEVTNDQNADSYDGSRTSFEKMSLSKVRSIGNHRGGNHHKSQYTILLKNPMNTEDLILNQDQTPNQFITRNQSIKHRLRLPFLRKIRNIMFLRKNQTKVPSKERILWLRKGAAVPSTGVSAPASTLK